MSGEPKDDPPRGAAPPSSPSAPRAAPPSSPSASRAVPPSSPEAKSDPLNRKGPGRYDRHKSPDERASEQKTALLAAAAKVFARDGLAAGTVQAILEESGMSRATFYRHFEDLNAAFLAVLGYGGDLVFERIATAVRAEREASEKVKAAVHTLLGLLVEHGDVLRVMQRDALSVGGVTQAIRQETLGRFVELFREGIREGEARHILDRNPDERKILAILSAFLGVAASYLERNEEKNAMEAAPMMIEMCIRAFDPEAKVW